MNTSKSRRRALRWIPAALLIGSGAIMIILGVFTVSTFDINATAHAFGAVTALLGIACTVVGARLARRASK